MRRGGIYCRISKNDPNIPKVEDQEAMCRQLAKAHGVDVVVPVYVDDGISASHFSDKQRPDWIRLLDDVKAGRLDVILAQAEDRFSREPMEKAVLDDLCAANGVTYLTHADGVTDPSKASGRLGSGIKALVARYYVDTASEKHRDSNAAAARRGEPQRGGVRPFGWLDDKRTLHPVEAPLVAVAFADLISGKRTLSRIRTDFNNNGILTTRGGGWDITKVEAMIRRPRNAGIVTYRGERVLGDDGEPVAPSWEPIIDGDTYAAAIAILDNPKRRMTKVHTPKYLCSSIATCDACGTSLRSTSNARARTYRCAVHEGVRPEKVNGTHVSINVDVLDSVVTEAVVSAVLFAPVDAVPDADTSALKALHVRLNDVRKAEARLLELVESDVFSVAEIGAKRTALKAEADQIDAGIAEIAQRNARAALLADAQSSLWTGTTVSIDDAAAAKAQIRERFDALTLDQKRALVRGLVTVTVTAGRGPDRVKVHHLVAASLND